jgi:hypothetical protein
MNDAFLSQFREDPPPEFVRSLRKRLEAQQRSASALARIRWSPALAAAAVAALGAALLGVPALRAGAESFLEMFRVTRFAAVPYDAGRLRRLSGGVSPRTLFGEQTEVLTEAWPKRLVASIAEGSALAGIEARVPTVLPSGVEGPEVHVKGGVRFRLRLEKAKLDGLLKALAIEDIEMPPGIDGSVVAVETHPQLLLVYPQSSRLVYTFSQTRNPEVTLPAGLDPAVLAELCLRAGGLSTDEARSFAQTIDWSTTLMVPFPVEKASYRQLEIQGNPALLTTAFPTPGRMYDARPYSSVMWSDGDRAYGLSGPGYGTELIEMADSIR